MKHNYYTPDRFEETTRSLQEPGNGGFWQKSDMRSYVIVKRSLWLSGGAQTGWGGGAAYLRGASIHGFSKMVAWNPGDYNREAKVHVRGVFERRNKQACGWVGWGGWGVGPRRDDSGVSGWNDWEDGGILTTMSRPVEKQVWRKASALQANASVS